MTVEPLRFVRDHLSEIVDRVEREHELVIITRNGRDTAVVISPEELAELEETIEVLSDPTILADVREAWTRCGLWWDEAMDKQRRYRAHDRWGQFHRRHRRVGRWNRPHQRQPAPPGLSRAPWCRPTRR